MENPNFDTHYILEKENYLEDSDGALHKEIFRGTQHECHRQMVSLTHSGPRGAYKLEKFTKPQPKPLPLR